MVWPQSRMTTTKMAASRIKLFLKVDQEATTLKKLGEEAKELKCWKDFKSEQSLNSILYLTSKAALSPKDATP